MIRRLSRQAIEVQKDLYLCFIDYERAFNKVQLELLEILGKFHQIHFFLNSNKSLLVQQFEYLLSIQKLQIT